MAVKTILVSDMDKNTEIDEKDAIRQLITWGGKTYNLVLSKDDFSKLDEYLGEILEGAEELTETPRPKASAPTRDLGDMREWLNENGYEVSARGRIPSHMMEAYDQKLPADRNPEHRRWLSERQS